MHKNWETYFAARGQGTVEYALLIAMVGIVVILALAAFSGGLSNTYSDIGQALSQAAGVEIAAEVTREATAETTGEAGDEDVDEDVDDVESGEIDPSDPEPVPDQEVPADTSDEKYYYDFFDGKGNISWRNFNGGWAPVSGFFTSNDTYAKAMASIPFPDYEFTVDVQTLQSRGAQASDITMVLFRAQSEQTYYAVMIHKDGMVELAKSVNGKWQGWLSVTLTRLNPFDTHAFRIRAFDEHIQVFIDKKKYIDYRDDNPIAGGDIGFANNNSVARVDNVEVDQRAAGKS
jgi:Flp pilus assembly pilin Flp